MTGQRLTGSCQCGSIKFSIPAESAGVFCCHCGDCRKSHGNYMAVIGAPRNDVQFESDATLQWYARTDKARRGFCSTCGSRLFKDNLGTDLLMVSAGVIDGATGKHIVKNILTEFKGDWYPIPEAHD
ncbi:GFA family protein [Pararhizobium sp.]|uniref:GFA family protein n=1 Tax=Pararhizobium sp. TaxID=1977563 RepID=UPI002728CDED|nr:GFA family protein [Pararhizobium sp.]MDO9418977.1 GFA family protein [Pararhizobium sp.]